MSRFGESTLSLDQFCFFIFDSSSCVLFLSSSLLQRPDANPGVQPGNKNCVEFSQAPADGKDPVHPRLPRRPQDIKERKSAHPQHDPSPLRARFFLVFSLFCPPLGICCHASKSLHSQACVDIAGGRDIIDHSLKGGTEEEEK